MALTKIPLVLLKFYFKANPPRFRLVQFNGLQHWTGLRPLLAELKPELWPPTVVTATEPATEAAADPWTAAKISDSPYPQYFCLGGNPLDCPQAEAIGQTNPEARNCQSCGFPALLEAKTKIQGQLGIYQVESRLGSRGMGRLYRAIALKTNQPVVIKEYLLPQRYFNPEERRQRQDAFRAVAGLSLADGRLQDLRLLIPLEAIADPQEERCYLIFESRAANPSLKSCLGQLAPFTQPQMHWFLNQALQTLELLHSQKFVLPGGQLQTGVAHGNLSLESLLLSSSSGADACPHPGQQGLGAANFSYLYLGELALWEQIFYSPSFQPQPSSIARDLTLLGQLSFSLLSGSAAEPGSSLNPELDSHWPKIDPGLKDLILRLLELHPPFESAAAARRALLQLPQPQPPGRSQRGVEPEPQVNPQPPWRRLMGLAAILGGVFLGAIFWALLLRSRSSPEPQATPALCCIQEVAGIPPGEFRYATVEQGTWTYVLQQRHLLQPGQTLAERLRAAQPNLVLNPGLVASVTAAIAQVESGQADFAIVPLPSQLQLPASLSAQAIAYDGLAILVPFSYARRAEGLPSQLKGQLSLEQLHQLYSGRITNWQALGGPALPVKLYLSPDPEAVEIFEFMIQLPGVSRPSQSGAGNFAVPATHTDLLRSLIRDFETQSIGSLGFAPLSKVFNQCAVYPLALQTPANPAVQTLGFGSDRPIRPNTDLCDQKGSYYPRVEVFQTGRYPLAYPIAVIYSRDNDRPNIGEKVVEIFHTQEGQRLLALAGLVPLKDIYREIFAPPGVGP